MKPKIITIILAIIVVAVGSIAGVFYNQKVQLTKNNANLVQQIKALNNEKNVLTSKLRDSTRLNEDLNQRLIAIQDELTRIQEERDSFREKWQEASEERDALVEALKKKPALEGTAKSADTTTSEGIPEEHWADFVTEKAALEATLAEMNQRLLDANNKVVELNKSNKELSIKIDELTKESEKLSEGIRFKERTMRVMSMDLVSEREERTAAVKEVKKLRGENISLKRELVLTNKEQLRLQNQLKATFEKKDALEKKIAEAENILKERSLVFEELQSQLQETIAGGKKVMASESASVELPPIVVRPSIPVRGVRGEVIAVNREEDFIVVDLGEISGVRPGSLLKVMRGDKEIALLEIIETRKEISAADIVEALGGYFVQEGDIVIGR